MKRLLTAVLFFSLITACDDEDDKNSNAIDEKISEVESTMTAGTWEITYYVDSGDDETATFADFTFTFSEGATNNLSATDGANTYTGSWSATNDDDSDDDNPDYDDVDFNIAFASPPDFAELTEDWEIISMTASKIELRHVSGGGGGTDLLTFEKK